MAGSMNVFNEGSQDCSFDPFVSEEVPKNQQNQIKILIEFENQVTMDLALE